ncbi:MAG: UDP-3-O-(3-hydroxymyristoyl)glucosamine N-acyltransferase [Hyphomicrobiales bacterium]|nr:UDP-3-O-(3-hydroxymyristoyl)glucosamine N-acyltransferase [Hyphomicrobiales bacterium]
MVHAGFFDRAGPFPLSHIAQRVEAEIADKDSSVEITDIRTLNDAGPNDLTFLDNRKYLQQLASTSARGCILSAKHADRLPVGTAVVATSAPYVAFARALSLFYPDSLRSKVATSPWEQDGKLVHPTAQIAENVVIEPGAVIGREASIGPGTIVTAGAVVGYRVVIGAECYIGAGASITHSLIGDNVIIHAGARIGQDGFGFAMSARGHVKIPQIGRVIIGDNVEIGANSTVDRGSLSDTVIGEGTKIDNQVQIAHNVRIGRHCVIVAQSGIAGSSELGDFVVMGAHSGVLGHIKVGSGVQIAFMGHVKDDVEPGAKIGGAPARPFPDWAREVAAVKRLGQAGRRVTGNKS